MTSLLGSLIFSDREVAAFGESFFSGLIIRSSLVRDRLLQNNSHSAGVGIVLCDKISRVALLLSAYVMEDRTGMMSIPRSMVILLV